MRALGALVALALTGCAHSRGRETGDRREAASLSPADGAELTIVYERRGESESVTTDIDARVDDKAICRRSSGFGLVEDERPLLLFHGTVPPGPHVLDVTVMRELPWATGIVGEPRRGHLGPYGMRVRFEAKARHAVTIRIEERDAHAIRGEMTLEPHVIPMRIPMPTALACATRLPR